MGDAYEFDLGAASWRHAHTDEVSFVEALADRLERSLPGLVQVERDHKLFAKVHRVVRLAVGFDGDTYILQEAHGRFEARRAKAVGGIVISSKVVPMSEWLSGLSAHVSAYARANENARRALEDFLL